MGVLVFIGIIYIIYNVVKEKCEDWTPISKIPTPSDQQRDYIARNYPPEAQAKAREYFGCQYPSELTEEQKASGDIGIHNKMSLEKHGKY